MCQAVLALGIQRESTQSSWSSECVKLRDGRVLGLSGLEEMKNQCGCYTEVRGVWGETRSKIRSGWGLTTQSICRLLLGG